jgi:hypothetical protein
MILQESCSFRERCVLNFRVPEIRVRHCPVACDSPRVSVATGLWPVYADVTQAKQDGSQSRGYSASRASLFVYDFDLLIDDRAADS